MPASLAKEWFLTVSPRSPDSLDLFVVHLKSYKKVHCVQEMGKDGSHPHLHAVITLDTPCRQDVIRKKFVLICEKLGEEPKICVVIKPVTDMQKLVGLYFVKEENVKEILRIGYLVGEIEGIIASQGVKVKRVKMDKIVSLCSAPSLMKVYAIDHNMPLATRADCRYLVSTMMSDGYNFVSVLPRLRSIWSQISCVCGDEWLPDEDNYFARTSE